MHKHSNDIEQISYKHFWSVLRSDQWAQVSHKAKFHTKQVTYQSSLERQFYHHFSWGDDVEAVHMHGEFKQTSEEDAEESPSIV